MENEELNRHKEWEIDNLPNRITMFRILLIPIIIFCMSINMIQSKYLVHSQLTLSWIAAIAFIVASITDFFDGYIARKRNIVTVFGSFLDPIADKFLVISTLILLQALNRIPVIIVIILVMREVYITALRLLASERGLSVPVDRWGKWKTAVQMTGIPFLLVYDKPWNIPMPIIGAILIYIASFLSIYSATQYSLGLLKKLKAQRLKKKQQGHEPTL